MKKKLYSLAWASLFTISALAAYATGFSSYTDPSPLGNSISSGLALEPPIVETYTLEGWNDLWMSFYNPNGRGATEIWRSLSYSSGYQLIATVPHTEGSYWDRDLKGRTTYYYRLRAVDGTEASEYVFFGEIQTYGDYYKPTVSARAIDPYTVEITFTDNSYYEHMYDFTVTNNSTGVTDVFHHIELPDSGQSLIFKHYPADPGTSYSYGSIAHAVSPEGGPIEEHNLASATTPGFTCDVGTIEAEIWNNVSGYAISSIPVNTQPDKIEPRGPFYSAYNQGDNFGQRMRAYLCVQQSGNYVFWISADDNGELWLSTDDNPANKKLIASTKWTRPGEWTKYPTQQSAAINLVAGKKYFIEALHKEASGNDHLEVGWKLPDGTIQRPILGTSLIKFERKLPPWVTLSDPDDWQEFTAPATVDIAATAGDNDGTVTKVEFFAGGNFLAEDRTAPYTYRWQNVQAGEYLIEARATDNDGFVSSHYNNIRVKAAACTGTGGLWREIWTNITGTDLSSVPFNTNPQGFEVCSNFETVQYSSNNYGSRMRGYICPPATGAYTFWISSDDRSELYLSTDDNVANKKLIASVTGYTQFRQYDKYPSQKSALINLVAGRRYYVEARHKEGTGNDFISVGWQLPNGTKQLPIPGSNLIKHESSKPNQPPSIVITSPQPNENFSSPASVLISANATDPEGDPVDVQFDVIYGSTSQRLATFTAPPYEFQWNNVPEGSYHLIVAAGDNRGANTSKTLQFTVNRSEPCEGAGNIYREIWTGIPGTSISSIPFESEPDKVVELTKFETQNYYANEYGSRIRGYLCAPVTGGYTFWIASDDNSELWLSDNADPATKHKIAYVTGATLPLQWTKYLSQRSRTIDLVAGQLYYVEVLHKEGGGADHVAVGWELPSGALERPIPGNRLVPFEDAAMMAARTAIDNTEEESAQINLFPNPTLSSSRDVTLTLTDKTNEDLIQGDVEVVSMTGRVVYSKAVDCPEGCRNFLITLEQQLPPGIYVVNLKTSERKLIKRLVVK